jgi:hypothetical protein
MQIADLLTLGEPGLERMQEDIAKQDGVINIFIHPFFMDYERKSKDFAQKEKARKEFRLKNFLKAGGNEGDFELIEKKNADKQQQDEKKIEEGLCEEVSVKDSVVMIFEETKNKEKTVDRLNELIEKSDNPVYIVPTIDDNPMPKITPLIAQLPLLSEENFQIMQENWDDLTDRLKSLGVEKIILGGQKLESSSFPPVWALPDQVEKYFQSKKEATENTAKQYPSSCVGVAAIHLVSRDIGVEYSSYTSPKSYKEE